VTGVDYDAEIETVVVRTERATDYEEKLGRRPAPRAAPSARSSAT
jgi:hypothetical protein